MIMYLNGRVATDLPIGDRGLAYGDGVFETIALDGTQPQLWQAHWQRLSQGLARLGFANNLDDLYVQLCSDIKHALVCWSDAQSANQESRAVLKITITRGTGGRGYLPPEQAIPNRIVQVTPWPQGRDHIATEGAQVHVCQHPWGQNAALAGLKHLNRLDQVLARQEWRDDIHHEGLMLNQAGNVQSGVMSNVFVEREGVLYTPCNDTAGIDGIMAKQVMRIASDLNIPVKQQVFDLDFVSASDGLMLTNSLNGVWPVAKLGQQVFPITATCRQIQAALAAHLQASTEPLAC